MTAQKKPNHKKKGWRGDPYRHALSSYGISTKAKGKGDKSPLDSGMSMLNTMMSLLSLGSGGRIRPDASARIRQFNERTKNEAEWIADFDEDEEGRVIISDPQFSENVDESQMNWNEDITHNDRCPDPEHCVGYIHNHPPAVDPRPSAQDFILALTIDDLRLKTNKNESPATTFGVVVDDRVKLFVLTPKDDVDDLIEQFKSVQTKGYPPEDNDKYFRDLEEIKDDLKNTGQLQETGWIRLDESGEE